VDEKTLAVLAEARDELIRKDAMIGRLSALIQEKAPFAEVGEAIITAGKWFTVAKAAKEMAIDLGDGKRMGQNQLYAFLRSTRMVLRRKDPASGWT
jgi:phage antirepressor YoqD-like protein